MVISTFHGLINHLSIACLVKHLFKSFAHMKTCLYILFCVIIRLLIYYMTLISIFTLIYFVCVKFVGVCMLWPECGGQRTFFFHS